jgi:ferritin
MNNMILHYLNKTYVFKIKTLSNYKVFTRNTNNEIHLSEVYVDIKNVFSLDDDNLNKVFDKWIDDQITIINNNMVKIQYYLNEKIGF